MANAIFDNGFAGCSGGDRQYRHPREAVAMMYIVARLSNMGESDSLAAGVTVTASRSPKLSANPSPEREDLPSSDRGFHYIPATPHY